MSPVYLATDFEDEPRNMEPAKCGGIGWFGLDALPAPLTTAAAAAVAALARRDRAHGG